MAFDLASLTPARARTTPPLAVLYGPPGTGKTTFGACMEAPVILPTEDGLESLKQLPFDVPTFPLAKTFADVTAAIGSLYSDPHEFKTLVVDSLDWLEPIIQTETCARNQWADIEAPGYGKGYLAAIDVWMEFFDGLNYLRRERGMSVLLIAHSVVKRHDDPETDPYDRYMLKLQARAEAKVMEAADMVLFVNYRATTVAADVGFNKKVKRGVGTGERVLYTEERPAFMAKNRHALPASLPFTWEALAAAMAPASLPATADEPAAATPAA